MKPIAAVLVMYQIRLEDSTTYRSLRRAEAEDPALRGVIDLYVADNSPVAQEAPSDFLGTYLHDGENCGLARRYNQVLNDAKVSGAVWLLTLDQDLEITCDYMRELLDLSQRLEPARTVAVVVPKLMTAGLMRSPMKPTHARVGYTLTLESTGVVGSPLRAFNSGALVRVSALQAAGGYPESYWLDYLDHAMFAKLQNNGGQIYVMRSVLKHALSQFTEGEGHSPERRRNIVLAEERFYFEFGTFQERVRRKLNLLRQVVGHIRRGRLAKAAGSMKFFLHTRRQVSGLARTARSGS